MWRRRRRRLCTAAWKRDGGMKRNIIMRQSFTMTLIGTALMLFTAGAVRAGTEDEVKAIFDKFVAAQNAHDLKAVSEILQDSPQMFWITRGQVYLGRDAA